MIIDAGNFLIVAVFFDFLGFVGFSFDLVVLFAVP